MPRPRLPWQQELKIIDVAMRGVSDITDPNLMVRAYWDSIRELLPDADYLALSRRGVEPPDFLITRSARFTEHFNPWTQRDRLPRLRGGLLGEIAYADAPVVIEDLPARLHEDDPGSFYLRGYQALVALPQYEDGKGLNVGMTLYDSAEEFDPTLVPMMHWQASLFGRGTQSLVLRNQLQSALAALDRELRAVGQIQRSLLPASLPDLPGVEFAAHYHTSASAGGDYYDFFPLDRVAWASLSPTCPATEPPRRCSWPSPTRSPTPPRALSPRPTTYSRTSTQGSQGRTRSMVRSSPPSTPSSTRSLAGSPTPAPATTHPGCGEEMASGASTPPPACPWECSTISPFLSPPSSSPRETSSCCTPTASPRPCPPPPLTVMSSSLGWSGSMLCSHARPTAPRASAWT